MHSPFDLSHHCHLLTLMGHHTLPIHTLIFYSIIFPIHVLFLDTIFHAYILHCCAQVIQSHPK